MLNQIKSVLEDNILKVLELESDLGIICQNQYQLLLSTDSTFQDFVAVNKDVSFIIELYQLEKGV